MNTRCNNNKGYTIVGTLIIITVVSLMSTSIIGVSNSGSESGSNDLQSLQATHVGGGGLQYAMHQLSYGLSPDIADHPLGTGTFTITTDPSTQVVTVASAVGKAKKTQTVTTDFSNDKTGLNINNIEADDDVITGLTLDKNDGKQVVLTGVTVNWNFNNCAEDDSCEDNDKVSICHIPPGNPNNKHTISVSSSSQQAHLAHGDYLGPCDPDEEIEEEEDDQEVCEGTLDQMTSCDVDDGNYKVKKIVFDGTTLFSGTADAGEKIIFDPIYLQQNQSYSIDEIEFSEDLPGTGWYSITLHFADNSDYVQTFKFTQADDDCDDDDDDDGNNGNGNDDDGDDDGNNGNGNDDDGDDDGNNGNGNDDDGDDDDDDGNNGNGNDDDGDDDGNNGNGNDDDDDNGNNGNNGKK